ncbi:hypothetical protein D3C80_1096030 [compost metagenome]
MSQVRLVCGHIAASCCIYKRYRRPVYWAISDLLGESFLSVCLQHRLNEANAFLWVSGAFRNSVSVHVINTPVPDNTKIALVLHRSDASIVSRAHYDVAGSEILRRLSACLPPLNIGFNLVELSESSILTFPRTKYGINVLWLNTVSHQCELQCIHCSLTQAPLAWEFHNIPKINPTSWCGF